MSSRKTATAEQKGFDFVGKVSEKGAKPGRSLVDRLFSRWVSSADRLPADWSADADWARIQQEPLRARKLLFGVLLTLIALVIWAAYAEVDEVTRGDGRVIPSQQLQVVQSLDGGVIEEVNVREGDLVEPGDILMRIEATRFVSTFRESRAQYLSTLARVHRLRALTEGEEFVVPDEVVEESPEIARREERLYRTRVEELDEQIAIARSQLQQRQDELNEARARERQAGRAYDLASRELELTRPMLRSGAVSEVDVLRLEREVSNASGEREQARSQIQRLQGAISEAETKIREIEISKRNEWRESLNEALGDLASLSEGGLGLADRVRLADIRAPVRGTVQRVHHNTIGGVVQPGGEVVEIVPMDDQLLVEARIPPKDIAFLRPGQDATVKFSAYDFTIYGGMDGTLEHISADTITDENDNTYYLVRVRTEDADFGEDRMIIPGMTTQVDILTGKNTILQYLLKPVLRATSNALSER